MNRRALLTDYLSPLPEDVALPDSTVRTKMVDSRRNLAWQEIFDFETAPSQTSLYVRIYEYNINKCVGNGNRWEKKCNMRRWLGCNLFMLGLDDLAFIVDIIDQIVSLSTFTLHSNFLYMFAQILYALCLPSYDCIATSSIVQIKKRTAGRKRISCWI